MKNAVVLALVFASLVFAGCVQQAPQSEPPMQGEPSYQATQQANNSAVEPQDQQPTPQAQLSLTSSAFANNGGIPMKYTCNGGDVIPPIEFEGVPQNTQSLVLIIDDPDAREVVGFTYTHWVVFNIPPMSTGMPEGTQIGIIGASGGSQNRYEGPCPPEGRTHTYSFRLYALDTELPLQEGASKEQVETAMQGHVLGQAELKGVYGQ